MKKRIRLTEQQIDNIFELIKDLDTTYNDFVIELTDEQISDILENTLLCSYYGREFENYMEDVRMRITERMDGGDFEYEFSDEDVFRITERFQKSLGRNDLYWDVYWEQIDSVIDDYEKKFA